MIAFVRPISLAISQKNQSTGGINAHGFGSLQQVGLRRRAMWSASATWATEFIDGPGTARLLGSAARSLVVRSSMWIGR